MTFETILQGIVDDCGGGFSAALMGLDGIAVAQVTAKGGRDREDPLGGDATFAGIEFGRILGDMSKASDALDAGPLRESVISLARVQLVFHTVDEDLVLVLALRPDGNLGKARYLIRRNLPAIRAAL
jgi:predicted regulator of Ras-like GTPase activity (Roadblock/LC7/MglB family)